MSFLSAQSQNSAVSQGMAGAGGAYQRNLDALIKKREVTAGQVKDSGEIKMMQNYFTGLKLGGKMRAYSAARGTTTSMEGTASRLETQTILDRLMNSRLINQNTNNALRSVNSDYESGSIMNLNQYTNTVNQLAMQYQDPMMGMIQGGIQGYSTGVAINS